MKCKNGQCVICKFLNFNFTFNQYIFIFIYSCLCFQIIAFTMYIENNNFTFKHLNFENIDI